MGSDTAAGIDTPPTCGVSGAHSNAGSYDITCSGGVDNNYDFAYVKGTLTVSQKAITITPNSGQSKVYGDNDPTLTYTASSPLEGSDSYSGGSVAPRVRTWATTLLTWAPSRSATATTATTTTSACPLPRSTSPSPSGP